MNKVTIVGKSGNGECIVTAILQSCDPKSGHVMELKLKEGIVNEVESKASPKLQMRKSLLVAYDRTSISWKYYENSNYQAGRRNGLLSSKVQAFCKHIGQVSSRYEVNSYHLMVQSDA
ncbi:hypothetical protein CMV_022694 [Castanea mollissima]|uniref:Uncharacterized protein n=1 Tax=Castanea mollissima TaxID=60419 RepID=A0A8J4QHI6_9ROSI|nr:hypothetical protein CMV_022694 [Castanea mollissima]